MVTQTQERTQTDTNRDLFYQGQFDGGIALEPRYPENHAYWQGYVIKLREYWLNGKSLPSSSTDGIDLHC